MGRYSAALHKIGPTCNPNNPCSGKYGKCLDLKLTNTCNGNCPFCIEEKGYCPADVQNPEELAKKINAMQIDSLLILGGEPLLYPDIVGLVSRIRKNINIFITTNGSLLTPELAKDLLPHIKGINISIHHSTSTKHKELTKIELKSDVLYKSVKVLGDKVRINCNLVRGYVDSKLEVEAMYDMLQRLRVKKIRFAELQSCPAMYVNARTIFDNVPADPFQNGCEITVPKNDFEVTVRVTCGIIDKDKNPVINPTGRNAQTQVMYSNGMVANGWRTGDDTEGGDSCHVNEQPRVASSAGCGGGSVRGTCS